MLDEQRFRLRKHAVELHHDWLGEDLRLLRILRTQRLLEPRDAPLGTHAPLRSPLRGAFGTFRRTWKTPCSFFIRPIPIRIIDPTA